MPSLMTGHEGEEPTEEKREPVREGRRRHQENEGIHRAEELWVKGEITLEETGSRRGCSRSGKGRLETARDRRGS